MTLGLDIGANSIGWALVDPDGGRLIASGVRVFPEGVDNFDTKKEAPKMEGRRVARGMRRQVARRSERKRQLRRLLTGAGLLPTDATAIIALDGSDPYDLRRRALVEHLTPHEIGRALVHLNQRRGFKSNRKSDRSAKASEKKGLLAEISALAADIEQAGHATLGAHLAALRADPHHRIRGRHTRRDMFEHEFDAIWAAQAKHHPDLLSDALRRRVHRVMFFQRRLYWPLDVVGRCELEPRLRRCPRADRLAQRFRLLQEVNGLRYYDPDAKEERSLAPDQRAVLLDRLSKRDKLTFDQVRETLGFIESIAFNLERGERKSLKGLPVDAALAKKDVFGPAWHDKPEAEKDMIVRALIETDDDDALREKATGWGLTGDAIDGLLKADAALPTGYAAHSRKALELLLPHMERGLLYMTDDGTPCALAEAGYLRPDQRPRKVMDFLPDPPDMANPVVRQALHEVRKVVNAIVREHGKPARIHVELARDAAMTAEDRQKASKRRQDNEDRRSSAADAIRAAGHKVNRPAIDRYLLWQEQGGRCAFSGDPISIAQLFTGEADIDHILPYSKCLDDSMGNKVVAFQRLNAEKGNRTPREWLEATPERYERVLQFAARLPYPKRRRFIQKELDEDAFVARQLNDTRYIARTVSEYVRCLVAEPHHVLCPKGNHTAELRRQWGLGTLLEEFQDSPAWVAKNDLHPGEKNRADHRHHTIDAIVVALTDQSRLQHLSRIKRQGGTEQTGEELPEPWPNFRASVADAVRPINVSHRVQRRVSGALHEETLYGPVFDKQLNGEVVRREGEFVVRKPVESLTPSMVEDIRDPAIRQIVLARLAERGVEYGRGVTSKIPSETWVPELAMPSGVPIRKVRLIKRELTIRPIRNGTAWVKPGSTHHLCIFEFTEKGKRRRDAVFVTMLDAADRVRRGEPIISRVHPDRTDARFVMSLSRGELALGMFKGRERLVKFKTAASTQGQIYFVDHRDARRDSGDAPAEKFAVKASTLKARKVTVDPLGRIRWADAFAVDDITQFDPRVVAIARARLADPERLPLSAMRKRMAAEGVAHLGAQLSRLLRRDDR